MSNVWKVVIGICVAIALLIVIALGAVYFAWQHSQKIAQEIYGGPLAEIGCCNPRNGYAGR